MNRAGLEQMARQEVETLRRQLPPGLAKSARKLPVVLMPRPTRSMIYEDGIEPDLLGLFVGANLADGIERADPLPPEIFLFLDTIWDFSGGAADVFREEVRRTYYHELGHYLGLDEMELEDRGLQ